MKTKMDLISTRKFRPLRTAGLVLAWMGLALLPVVTTGCGHNAKAGGEVKKSTAVEVGATSPVRNDLTREVQQPGFLRPYEQTPIYTKIAGFAYEPKYDIGDYVKKGALLLELYVPEVKTELKVKAARITQAQADLKQAKENANAAEAGVKAAAADVEAKKAAIDSADAEVKRWHGEVARADVLLKKGLYDQGTRDQDFNQWKSSLAKVAETMANLGSADANLKRASAHFNKTLADIEVAAASVEVAQATHDQWADWLSYRNIVAPFDGVVTLRNVHSGHFLQPSNSGSTSKAAEPLFVMMRTDIMRCVVEVPELDAVLVKDGDKAVIQFDAMPGVETIGVVQRNAGALDERTRTLRVEVWLKNPTGATVNFTASDDGVITSVEAAPPAGGSKYPPNRTIPLVIAGGTGGVVNATTNSAGEVIRYALSTAGYDYVPGAHVKAGTIANVLRPYMYAHVTILGKVENAWTLPTDAVMSDILANANRSFCLVVEDGKAHKMFLQIGARCADGVQVLRKQRFGDTEWQEITGKEIVVTTNTKALQDGQEVKVKAPETH